LGNFIWEEGLKRNPLVPRQVPIYSGLIKVSKGVIGYCGPGKETGRDWA